jgi:hypothetical protein
MDCIVWLCFWAPRHSLHGPSVPPRAGAISFWGDCLPAPAALQWRMAISTHREKTLEECKRHIDECAALVERTSVPEYREAIIAMGKAWMKIAEQAKQAR